MGSIGLPDKLVTGVVWDHVLIFSLCIIWSDMNRLFVSNRGTTVWFTWTCHQVHKSLERQGLGQCLGIEGVCQPSQLSIYNKKTMYIYVQFLVQSEVEIILLSISAGHENH